MCKLITFIKNFLLITISIHILIACGGGDSDSTNNQEYDAAVTGTTSSDKSKTTTLSGSVGDGPIIGSTIVIKNSSGDILKTLLSDERANYNISIIVKDNDYPLIIEATGGIDLVTSTAPDFTLYSTAVDPSVKHVNINPFSTLIVKTAESMVDGLNSTNIKQISNQVSSMLGFGLDKALVPDPITTQITTTNIAVIVKASEAFGEMIRRTRDFFGDNMTADQVLTALAADFTDGKLDGAGASGTTPSITTLSNIISAQVLLESLSNDLNVMGTDSTDRMDNSILATTPDTPLNLMTDNVTISADMLSQTRSAIETAITINNSPTLRNIADALTNISTGSLSTDIVPFESTDLDNTITLTTSIMFQ